jgi:hypothetical protein
MNRRSASGAEGAPSPEPRLATLPSPDTQRWVARRKAEVVNAVEAGLLPLDEALCRYRLTIEEFATWQRGLLRHGLGGLKAARLHHDESLERIGQARRPWAERIGSHG